MHEFHATNVYKSTFYITVSITKANQLVLF
jgi:hypothetical protein